MIDGDALSSVFDDMYTDVEINWNSVELHDRYTQAGGMLGRRQMFTMLTAALGDAVVVLKSQGCSSLVGCKNFVMQTPKLVKDDGIDSESVDNLVRQIRSEAASVPAPNDYNLADFTATRIVEDTSPTLVQFISALR